MRQFDGNVHTPEALTQEIANIYRATPDTLLVGSLGRAVVYNSLVGNPYYEFERRAETPVEASDRARDIDVIVPVATDVKKMTPFDVDTAFNNRLVSIVAQGADWYLVSARQGTYETIHPAVMEPVEGESVFGIPCLTVPTRTHIELFGLKDCMRPKDEATKRLLESTLGIVNTKLPEDLYAPFERLRYSNNSGAVHHIRQAYRAALPLAVRRKLIPLTQPIKDKWI